MPVDPTAQTETEFLVHSHEFKEKGKGLNSIPVRFALMSLVICSLGFALQYYMIFPNRPELSYADLALIALTLCLPALVTFLAASKLTGMIGALRQSTLAILDGEVNSPVDVDCECEVGGLADSFRAMVARLNGNILRMNILAYTDNVTGLPNRAVIDHVLELARTQRPEDCNGSMFFIDLDGFKKINDTFGHDVGDELLRLAAWRIVEEGFGVPRDELDNCTTTFGELCDTCPTNLVFARFAGDEFVALLPGLHSSEELIEVGHTILDALSPPFEVMGNEIAIGASIGVASIEEGLDDPRDLLIHSDIAMYESKQNGKNCVSLFDVDLKAQIAEKTAIEKELRLALEADDLTLHFQPKVCAVTHSLLGAEALARWHHPVRGYVPPSTFIPIAEQSGAMGALGQTVLKLAAQQAKIWHAAGPQLPIAVNVSPVQFESGELVSSIMEILRSIDLDPNMLEIEVTETLAMSDYVSTKRRLDALRAEGIRIAIDDFGTGYSNLSQLSRLNFDALKVDRSLTNGIGKSAKGEAILRATIDMAHALGHPVIAEGIETLEQMQVLRQLGCDQLQGYYVAQPMLPSDLLDWHGARTSNGIGELRGKLQGQLGRLAGAA